MKHLFLVHSPITYLVSISVIQKLKIPKQDAVLLFHEFNNEALLESNRYTGLSITSYYSNSNFFQKTYNHVRYFNIITRIDNIINKIISDEKFIAYVPVLTPVHKILITHKQCSSFNFIEEGLAQYYKEETLESLNAFYSKYSWRTSLTRDIKRVLSEAIFVLRGYNVKLQGLPFSYSSYHALKNIFFYGVSKEAFPLVSADKKEILSFDKESFLFVKQDSPIDLNNKIIWIGDPGVVHHGFNEKTYLQGIQDGCIGFIKQKEEKNVLLKFHRDEPERLRKKIKKLFNDNDISVEIISDTVLMELYLFESKNVTLIGVYSSLLYYASLMGHESFSIYEFLKEEYYRALQNRDFTFYWNKVTLITPPVSYRTK